MFSFTERAARPNAAEVMHGHDHGMPTTQAETINADLLAWLNS